MNDSEKDEKHLNNEQSCKLVKNPRTGLTVISGPSFSKEDIDRDFPKGSGWDARIMRKSVRLPTE